MQMNFDIINSNILKSHKNLKNYYKQQQIINTKIPE